MGYSEEGRALLAELERRGARLMFDRDGNTICQSERSGIASLLEVVRSSSPEALRNTRVADTVVGKAAALLLVRAEIGFVAARTMSEPAAATLRTHGIPFHAEVTVPMIHGRVEGRPCPFEHSVEGIDDPDEALNALEETAERLMGRAR